jgi:hypothetical protein
VDDGFGRCNAVEAVVHFNGATRKETRKAFTSD